MKPLIIEFNNMTEFKRIAKDIILQLAAIDYDTGDLSDIGNEVGIAIARFTMRKDAKEKGFDIDNFIIGLEHGISLQDGTH